MRVPSMADPSLTSRSTSATATRTFTEFPGSASDTVSWSRSRESSLSREHQRRSRRSRTGSWSCCRGRGQVVELGEGFGGKVREQAPVKHRLPGDLLQQRAVLVALFVHEMSFLI